MNLSRLVWVFHETTGRFQPEGSPPVSAVLAQLLTLLHAHPRARLAIHLTGYSLEKLGEDGPGLLAGLRLRTQEGRLEWLLGGYSAPYLGAISEPDASLQLRLGAQLLQELTGVTPTGAWLPAGIWDPALPSLLARHELRYTFLETRRLAQGLSRREPVNGVYVAERQGFPLSLLPLDNDLSARLFTLSPDAFLAQLQERMALTDPLIGLSLPLERLGSEPDWPAKLNSLLGRLLEEGPRVELVLPQEAVRQCLPKGRVAPPASLSSALAEQCVPPELIRSLDRAKARAESAGETWPEGLTPTGSFEGLLERYPEANRLHKRLLLLSSKVQRLRRLYQQKGPEGDEAEALAQACARAEQSLYTAQTHRVYLPGVGGLHDPRLRSAVWREVLAAWRITEAAFFPEARYVAVEHVDFDRDGLPEVLVSTPRLQAGLSLRGGALFDFCHKPSLRNLTDVVGRRVEAGHERLPRGAVSEPKRRLEADAPQVGPKELELSGRLKLDRYPRLGCLDHVLGQAAGLENVERCQYPEEGDFLHGVYELVRTFYDRKAQSGGAVLARNGVLLDGDGEPAGSLRIEKTFTFSDLDSTLQVRYALTNRGHQPVRFRFGTELSLAAPLHPAGLGLDGVASSASSGLARGEAQDRLEILFEDGEGGLQLVLKSGVPAHWWWFPLETLTETDGEILLHSQGYVVIPHWDVSLWGEETRVLELSLEVRDPAEEETMVIDDG